MRKSLLMWIVPPTQLDTAVQKIKDVWKPEGKIFVMVNRYDIPPTEFYISWNTLYEFRIPGVIKLNRKGTTLFTIDALNLLAIQENGKIDRAFVPNWNEFENQILLTSKDGKELSQIPTIVYETIG